MHRRGFEEWKLDFLKVLRRGERLPMSRIRSYANIPASEFSKVLKELEKDGLVAIVYPNVHPSSRGNYGITLKGARFLRGEDDG